MLRQIKRVVKFWREYIGDQCIESVGNKELSGYIEWRKSYYAQFKTLPKNAKLNPADKTLQWETTLAKSIIRWAHEQGYRGDQPSKRDPSLCAKAALAEVQLISVRIVFRLVASLVRPAANFLTSAQLPRPVPASYPHELSRERG